MTRDEMESRANAEADKIVTDTHGEIELGWRKDHRWYIVMGGLAFEEAKRIRGEA